MNTVFANPRLSVAAALVASTLLSGCSSLLPNSKGGNASADDVVEQAAQQKIVSGHDAPLPRQRYSLGGDKIPYDPEPNPYNSSSDGVDPEAVKLYHAAMKLKQQGDLKQARQKFQAITRKYPELSGPWLQLGEIAEARDKTTEAMASYQKAIAINEDNVNAYVSLGLLQRKQGHFGAAQKTYLQALEVWKDFPEAHLNLAILYDLYVNQPEQAQKHYEAYDFLTGGKNEKVKMWLVEVKRRTGIEKSFIDNPPEKKVVEAPSEARKDNSQTEASEKEQEA